MVHSFALNESSHVSAQCASVFRSCCSDSASLGTCQKLAEGEGVETEGGSQLFEPQKREGS